MKTRLLTCLLVLGILSVSMGAEAKTTGRHKRVAVCYRSTRSSSENGRSVVPPAGHAAALDSITRLLRLKLYLGPYDWDDIAIGFNSGASPLYNPNEDSKYMPGINAAEGLASLSSDGVELSVNLLPLPNQNPDVIRLDVEAQNSGPITLKRTELDSISSQYRILLIDKYKKDTIDLRTDSNYVFNINKADTNTFGTSRFVVFVCQDPAQQLRLVSFNAEKANGAAQISWTTANEANCTHFAVERSSDGGATFDVIDSLLSNGKGSYSYTDKNPPQTSDDYRLRMTDLNGAISYSNTVTLSFTSDDSPAPVNPISLYPNPTNGVIRLTIGTSATPSTQLAVQSIAAPVNSASTAAYSIRIVNISGMTVKTSSSSGNTWQDNVASLSPGTYVITVVDSGSNKVVGRSTFVKM